MIVESASERLTVTLTPGQARHVADSLLNDLEQAIRLDAEHLRTADHRDLIRRTLDSYERRLSVLHADPDAGGTIAYTDRRCELEELAADLLQSGAEQAGDEMLRGAENVGERRELLRQAEAGGSIYDQLASAKAAA